MAETREWLDAIGWFPRVGPPAFVVALTRPRCPAPSRALWRHPDLERPSTPHRGTSAILLILIDFFDIYVAGYCSP